MHATNEPSYIRVTSENMLRIITHNYKLVTLRIRDHKRHLRPRNYAYFTRPFMNSKDALQFVKSLQTVKYDEL